MKIVAWTIAAALLVATLAACGEPADPPDRGDIPSPAPQNGGTLVLVSGAFEEGDTMPRPYTCDGEDVSPTLVWGTGPAGTESFAIVMDDPDAPGGTFTHWIYYDIPGTLQQIPGRIEATDTPAAGGVQGTNDFGETGYNGPCPPPNGPHRYQFTIYALDAFLDLGPGASVDELRAAMEDRVLAEARITVRYGR